MKLKHLTYIFICLQLIIIALPTLAAQQINLVYPKKCSQIDAPATYFVGNTAEGSTLTINNNTVQLNKGGIFVKLMPLAYGCNKFKLKSTKGAQAAEQIITVNVPYPEKSLPQYPLQIAPGSISPKNNAIYSSGDIINVSFKASPGAKGFFSIGNKNRIPLTELPPKIDNVKNLVLGEVSGMPDQPVAGYYNGVYEIKPSDKFNQAPLKLFLTDAKGNTKTVVSKTTITSWNPDQLPKVGEVIVEKATVRTGPTESRLTPLPIGVKLLLKGFENGSYKYAMGPYMLGYISQNQIKLLSQGTPVPFSRVRNIKINHAYNSTFVNIPLTTKLPFSVEQSTDQTKLSVSLYGAKADTDIIKYDVNDKYLNQVKWSQPYQNVYVLDFNFNKQQQWGYDIYYAGDEAKGTLNLIILIKYPPAVNLNNPLAGKVIAIDPGHGGSEKGSIGPGQIPEKLVNLKISEQLKSLLEQQGASVILTRDSDYDVDLYKRPDLASLNKADILISIHNNALPDGRDPNKEHGSSAYYYHPMSYPLAKSIHNQLLKQLKLPDFGLYYDNLVLTRDYRMPCVLVEVAFMVNPSEYHMLVDPNFRQNAARAIFDGIKDFFVISH